MSFLTPFAFLLSLLALPILILYMLKLRRREVKVSSTLLWRAVLRDRQANTPWQKLRRNLLLFLQLLVLAGLVMALAQPVIAVPSVSSGSLIVLLDASASMNARDVAPTRFEAARAVVRNLIDGLSGDARMTLIQVGYQPEVLAASVNDHARLRRILQTAAPTNGEADWKKAFALASGAARSGQSNQPAAIVIVSDGGLPETGLPSLPGEVSYVPVGSSANNLGISALALRPAGENLELFAQLTNYSEQPRQVVLSIYRNGELINARAVKIASKDNKAITLTDLPAGESIYKARIEPIGAEGKELDALPLDDIAFAVHQGQKDRRILIISKGNFFLEQVLNALPNVTAYRALPASTASEGGSGNIQLPKETDESASKFDLYVLDGILPTASGSNLPVLPRGNLLLINPPPNVLFNVTGTFTDTQEVQVTDHPLTQYLDWRGVHIAKARYVSLPPWAKTLISSAGNPLVFAGETEGRRVAALTFDLLDSDLPLQIAFPILFAHLVDYLAPLQAVSGAEDLLPGESVRIMPGLDVQTVAVSSPEGRIYALVPDENDLLFSTTAELGVYAVNFLKETSQSVEFFAVNLFSEQEMDITPVDSIQVGRATIEASAQERLGRRALWQWFALLALGGLTLEWWVYHRRP